MPVTRRGPTSLAALALAAGLGLAACGSAPPGASHPAGPITIGAVYPLSGPQGGVPGGESEERGAALAAAWVNDHGGVGGRPIRLDVIDVPSAESVPWAMAQLEAEHVSLVIGTHGSTISAVAAVEAQHRHMLVWETGAVGNLGMDDDWSSSREWSSSAAAADLPGPVAGMGKSFFRMAPQGSSLGRAGIDFVLRRLAPELPGHPRLRVAVAYVTDAYGTSVAQGVVAQVRADGVPLAGVYPYSEYGANFTSIAAAIKRSGANVLYASSYLADGEALRRATIAEHVPLVASVGTSSSYCLPEFGDELRGAAVGLFASDKPAAGSFNPDGLLPEGRSTLVWAEAQWRRLYGGTMDAYATSGFANAYALFADVLPASASLTPAAVAAAATRVKLPAGTLADGSGMGFAPNGSDVGENQAAVSVIWEWVAPGREVVVWPPSFATQAPKVLPPET